MSALERRDVATAAALADGKITAGMAPRIRAWMDADEEAAVAWLARLAPSGPAHARAMAAIATATAAVETDDLYAASRKRMGSPAASADTRETPEVHSAEEELVGVSRRRMGYARGAGAA